MLPAGPEACRGFSRFPRPHQQGRTVRHPLRLSALAFGGLAVVAFLANGGAQAQNVASFVVADDDGYGVDTCLTSGDSCGKVVATAWCVANGYTHALDFRRAAADEVTGSVATPTKVAASDVDSVVITCEK